jgi:hypothetical protein
MAALLGIPAQSHTALLLAKRLLRQAPSGGRERPSPAARFWLPIVVAGIALGMAAGWFASSTTLRFF